MGVPKNGWFLRENPHLKWMMTRGIPIFGNLHIREFRCGVFISTSVFTSQPKRPPRWLRRKPAASWSLLRRNHNRKMAGGHLSNDGHWQLIGTSLHPWTGTSKMQATFREALPPTIYKGATFLEAIGIFGLMKVDPWICDRFWVFTDTIFYIHVVGPRPLVGRIVFCIFDIVHVFMYTSLLVTCWATGFHSCLLCYVTCLFLG